MNILRIQKKFQGIRSEDVYPILDRFRNLQIHEDNSIDKSMAIKYAQETEGASYDEARQALKTCNLDSSGKLDEEEFVGFVYNLRLSRKPEASQTRRSMGGIGESSGSASSAGRQRIVLQGSSDSVSHSVDQEERREFIKHANSVLLGDTDLKSKVPFDENSFMFFDECKDGLILAKLINDACPNTIDERILNKPKANKDLMSIQMTENNNIVIRSAREIGMKIVNIGDQDIQSGNEILIMGVLWQIIRRSLLSKIDIRLHPELFLLLEPGETLEKFICLPPEKILLRWFNYHLQAANWHRTVSNFSKDIMDSENYTVLLEQLDKTQCSRHPLQITDLHDRAEAMLQNADKLNCRKFVTSNSVVSGNPKLNLAFVAHLFNTHPGLHIKEADEVPDFDAVGEREARVFTLWLNSINVEPQVENFFDDLRDGYVILQALDKVVPQSVNWKRVSKPPASGSEMSRFLALENTNMAVDLGKKYFHLVAIQGADITDCAPTLVLGYVWQLMRKNIENTLTFLSQKGVDITDIGILRWANETAARSGHNGQIRSFKDPSLKTGIFLLNVLAGIDRQAFDYSLVHTGRTDEEAISNARLAISVARKLKAVIFIVPEDIVELRHRLIFTFIASLMTLT